MEIRTFEMSDLVSAKRTLKAAFFQEGSHPLYNEWEFAERAPASDGYVPELCLVAVEEGQVVGYNILTLAAIGGSQGLALGPLGVAPERWGRGIGSRLVEEGVLRAKQAGYPWIAVLGGDYYARFGFEKGRQFSVAVSEDEFANDHIQILFLDSAARGAVSGRVAYCSAFYDGEGNLL